MFKRIITLILVCLLMPAGVIVYYLQKPGLTPVDDVISAIEPPMYAAAASEKDNGLIPFLDPTNDLYGYQTLTGQTLITPQFSRAFEFSKHGVADVYMKESKEWLKIDKSGKTIVTSYFFDNGPDYYVNGLSRFVKNNKIGFIDRKGHIVIPAAYDWAGIFSYNFPITVVAQGCKLVTISETESKEMKGGKWGVIDRSGKVIIPLIYDDFAYTTQVHEGIERSILTFVQGDQKYQLFQNRWGKYVLIQVI